jgi:superoxide dismutase, Fe-Mn family
MSFEMQKLPYAYDALEPYIDAKTVELHYSKHHQTYLTNLKAAMEKHPNWAT